MNLTAQAVAYQAGGKTILSPTTVTIAPGKFTAIVGPNGAGKSTLLKILSGALIPTHGQATVGDTPLASFSPKDLAGVRAVLSQQSTVTFPFTVEEVVALGLNMLGYSQQQMAGIVQQVMHIMGVQHLCTRRYRTLSGGEQQRVQLARALAQVWEEKDKPRFLLLDEPTNNLDIAHQHALLAAARNRVSPSMGVLAIVHDLNLAAQYADHVIFMKAGALFMQGQPRQVITADIIQEVFQHPVKILYDDQQIPYVIVLPQRHHAVSTFINHTLHEQLSEQS